MDDVEEAESSSSSSSVKGGSAASASKGSGSKDGGGKRKQAMDHLLELLNLSHQQQEVEDEVCFFSCVRMYRIINAEYTYVCNSMCSSLL